MRVAQEIIAKLDSTLSMEEGLTKLNISLIERTGRTTTWEGSIFKQREDHLFLYERSGRGLEFKILSKDRGDRIFVYNVLSGKLFRKNEDEKYENFIGGFTFVDLSGYSYQANYNPLVQSDTKMADQNLLRVALKPILPYQYGKLVLFYNTQTDIPVRIDFYDENVILSKSLNIHFGDVKVKENGTSEKKFRVDRMEMVDLLTGTVTVLDFLEIDKGVKPDRSLFNLENLSRE